MSKKGLLVSGKGIPKFDNNSEFGQQALRTKSGNTDIKRRLKMDFTLNEEQRSLVALAKEFCKREVDIKTMNELADKPHPPNATKEQLMARIPWDLISKAHDVGLRQIIVPKKYGGSG
jgi:hypothetical protein